MINDIIAGSVLICALWLIAVHLCTYTWIQRQVFYAHRIPIWWGQRLNDPETFGFLKNQVTPFRILTSDRERLYAWLVTPLALYAKHEPTLLEDSLDSGSDITSRRAFKTLSDTPSSRLIIYFHGNAGTVGQTRRTDAYRMISSGASDTVHVLAFDYRGFGHSTGSPTEEGLIVDAVCVIQWAIDVAKIPPSRIVLVAQSLGTAVACAAANRFAKSEPKVMFAGVVLCAAFSDAATVFMSYSVGGCLPILAPLRISPRLSRWFGRKIKDTWKTSDQLLSLVSECDRIRLTLVHATSDTVIPSTQTQELFHLAVGATETEGITVQAIDERKDILNLGEGGYIHSWSSSDKIVQKIVVKHGGHNGIMKWAPVALATLKSFEAF